VAQNAAQLPPLPLLLLLLLLLKSLLLRRLLLLLLLVSLLLLLLLVSLLLLLLTDDLAGLPSPAVASRVAEAHDAAGVAHLGGLDTTAENKQNNSSMMSISMVHGANTLCCCWGVEPWGPGHTATTQHKTA
jgi:4-amino-4-deoxy-L-arabinose transferase-like glycosyltransferase